MYCVVLLFINDCLYKKVTGEKLFLFMAKKYSNVDAFFIEKKHKISCWN